MAPALSQLAADPRTRAITACYDAAVLQFARTDHRGVTCLDTIAATVRETNKLLAIDPPALRAPRLQNWRHAGQAEVARAIFSAARSTGVSAHYLWRTAARESGLNATAAAQSSSARGLFQFLDGTWLHIIAKHGRRHGVDLAMGGDGKPRSKDRAHLLALRMDPWIAARMAGELAQENRRAMEQALRRRVRDEDLYVAHFLGAADAVRLIQGAQLHPLASAVELLPAAARANSRVFQRRGRALGSLELLEHLRHG